MTQLSELESPCKLITEADEKDSPCKLITEADEKDSVSSVLSIETVENSSPEESFVFNYM